MSADVLPCLLCGRPTDTLDIPPVWYRICEPCGVAWFGGGLQGDWPPPSLEAVRKLRSLRDGGLWPPPDYGPGAAS